MKLHLPTRLRNAVLSCLTAVAALTTTLSSATLVAGVAAFSLSAGTVAMALDGPAASYEHATLPSGTADGTQGAEAAVTLTATSDVYWDFSAYKFLKLTVSAASQDVKLVGRLDSNSWDYVLSDVRADSLWLAQGSYRVTTETNLSQAGRIYLGGGQMQFVGGVTLDNDFSIGTSTSVTSPAELGRASFRVGHTTINNATVTLSGNIYVEEEAAIAFQNNNNLKLTGQLVGWDTLTLRAYNNSASSLILAPDGDNVFYGVISSTASSLTLKLGVDSHTVELGGLKGSFGLGLDEGIESAMLDLTVDAEESLRYTGAVSGNIRLRKFSGGEQIITSDWTGDVYMYDGSMTLGKVTGDVVVYDGTLTIDGVNGSAVVENGGELHLATRIGLTQLTVKSGATVYMAGVGVSEEATSWIDGFEYYEASHGVLNPDIIQVQEGGNLVMQNGGPIVAENAEDRVYVDASCLSDDGVLTINRGNVMVCDPDNPTEVAQSIAQASKIILDGGTLFSLSKVWTNTDSVSYVVGADLAIYSGGGTLRAYGDASTATVDYTNYTGELSGTGTLHKTDGGRIILSGNLGKFSGSVDIAGGTLELASNSTWSDVQISGAGNLAISGQMTMGGDQKLQTNLHILSGGRLAATTSDLLAWNMSRTITIDKDGEFAAGANRQTAGNWHFVLNGGTISGQGASNFSQQGKYAALDYHANGSITALEDSLVSATIRVRDNCQLALKVAEDKTLTMTGVIINGGKLALFAPDSQTTAGTVVLTGVNEYTGGTTVNAGALEVQGAGTMGTGAVTLQAGTALRLNNAADTTHVNAITGQVGAEVVKLGAAAITLSGLTDFAGTLRISQGLLGLSGQASATIGKVVTDGGSLLVDAAVTPTVLTVGGVDSPISLLVKNPDQIGEAGVRVFAAGTMDNANVMVDSVVSNGFAVSYDNGLLTRVAVTDTPTAGNLSWKVDGVSNNWGNTSANNWTKGDGPAQRWVDGSSVTFAGTGERVSVVSAVTADSVTVSGTGYEWVLGADKLTVTNGVTIADNADLTINGAKVSTFSGVVSGQGSLTIKNGGVLNLNNIVANKCIIGASATLDTLIVGEGTALELGNAANQATIDNITHLVVAEGGRFDLRHTYAMNAGDNNKTLTIAGAGNALAGPAAALTFAYAAQNNGMTINRQINLSDDATIYVSTGKNGTMGGGLNANNHTLTFIGGGTMNIRPADGTTTSFADVNITEATTVFIEMGAMSMGAVTLDEGSTLTAKSSGNVTLGAVSLEDGATLQYARNNSDTHVGPVKVTIASLQAGSKATDMTTIALKEGKAGRIEIDALSGSGLLKVVNHALDKITGSVLVGGNSQFDGTISVLSSYSGERRTLFGTNGHSTLARATVELTSVHENFPASWIGFVLAGDGSESIQVNGMTTGENMEVAKAYIISSDYPYSSNGSTTPYGSSTQTVVDIADGTTRTLEIVGGGEYTYSGNVLRNVNLLMNGSGTQTFDAIWTDFNGAIEARRGTLRLNSVASASAITLGGSGARLELMDDTLSVPVGKALSATAVGGVLAANVSLGQGSTLTFGTDQEAWGAVGGVGLAQHKLALDATQKAVLDVKMQGLEEGTTLQLFTDVASLTDANGAELAPWTGNVCKVSEFFATADGSPLGDYLLHWDKGTLSLLMKNELLDLVWNDGEDDNTWQDSSAHTNWLNDSASARFSRGDSVTFAGEGEVVTIVGTVNPLNVTVSSGAYWWSGDGSVQVGGTLVVGNDAHDAVSLYITNTGSKVFANGVEVLEGATLQVDAGVDAGEWKGYVSGAGMLTLSFGAGVPADFSPFIDMSEGAPTLGSLKLGDATLVIADASDLAPLKKVTDALILGDALNEVLIEAKETATLEGPAELLVAKTHIDVAKGKTLTISPHMEAKVTFGRLENGAKINKKGSGMLVLSGGLIADLPNGGIDFYDGTVKIDDAGSAAANTLGEYKLDEVQLTDAALVNPVGTLQLSNGSIFINTLDDDLTVHVATESAGDVVNLNSTVQGSSLDKITLAQGTKLSGVEGDITVGAQNRTTSMDLVLGSINVGSSATIADGKSALIEQTGNLIVDDSASVTLSIDAIVGLLGAAVQNETTLYLHLTNQTLQMSDTALANLDFRAENTSVSLLGEFGVRLDGIEGGSLKLSGSAEGIYTIEQYDDQVVGYSELSAYQATVVTSGKTLTMTLDGASETDAYDSALVYNLLGGTDSVFSIKNTVADEWASVNLRNKFQDIDPLDPAYSEAEGADTMFAGDIIGTAGAGDVEICISGPGTLTVGGDLITARLKMQEGGLTLMGNDNEVDTLADDGADSAADAVLTVNGMLTVADAAALSGTSIDGEGTLALENDLLLTDAATLDGVAVELVKSNFGAQGALLLDGVTDAEVSALSGAGSLQAHNGELTVIGQGGVFSGTMNELEKAQAGENLLRIAQGAQQTLDRVAANYAWSVENAGDLTISVTNAASTSGTGTNKVLALDTLTLKDGSETTFILNTDSAGTYINLHHLVIEDGATVAVVSTGLNELPFNGSLTLARTTQGVTLGEDVTLDLSGSTAFKKVREASLTSPDGKLLVIQTLYHDENQYELMADSENGMAGAQLLWSVNTGNLPNGSALKAVDEAVFALSKQATPAAKAKADEIMAAVAGSSTAILGSALASDVERQLRAIRNRTTTMGVSQADVNENMPYYNAWINAEGDHHEMDADGMAPGYTRDSWGGTVGFDVDVTPHLTMGLAVTAMYGDVESDGADKLDGDFDTQYVSFFARYARSAWTHTFVATVGRADITTERTVNYGTGSYTADGETEGMAFGLMYEVGRVYSLTEDGDVCMQPVFNVNFRQSTVDAYEETNCDAGLAVDEQSSTSLTFGVGARMQAVIGTSLYNRATILEARALAKFDAGDREGEADVRLLQGGSSASVKSAELGAFGAEVGVGVTIPMGSTAGSVFADGSLEVRSGYTHVNGTIGYRVNF